ncbi:MAG: isoaspartyl peptidase/L-asparaginase [Acidobacteriota bacterium]
MKKAFSFILIAVTLAFPLASFAQKGSFAEIKQLQSPQDPKLGFMIHGGADVMSKAQMTPAKEKELRAKLEEVVLAGYKALQDGRSSVEAVELAIRMMEDSPLFNAGKGAAFTHDGKNELESSIMDGKTMAAGATAGLRHIKNPITLARAEMERSTDLMMMGDGAEQFAKEQKVELVEEKYFWTQERWAALQQVLKEEKLPLPEKKVMTSGGPASKGTGNGLGAVGAVALDKKGNLASGTSTGGMTNKKYGRVGDTAIIGAGTFANNDSCAVSGTGSGDNFIRLSIARDIGAMMEYRALPVQQAADLVIQQKLKSIGGEGGVIAMDKFGNMAISFNTEGMYRAYIGADGKPIVEIYK